MSVTIGHKTMSISGTKHSVSQHRAQNNVNIGHQTQCQSALGTKHNVNIGHQTQCQSASGSKHNVNIGHQTQCQSASGTKQCQYRASNTMSVSIGHKIQCQYQASNTMSVSIGHKTVSVLGARHIVCTWDIVGQRTIGKREHNVCSFGYIGTV